MKSIAIAMLLLVPVIASAQQWSVEGHGNYARTTQTHLSSWGGGAQAQATLGGQHAPIQLNTVLGVDWLKQENSGPTTTSLGYDATIQPGGNNAITPHVGGSISANWLSGSNAPSGTLVGFNYIVGVQIKPESQGPLSIDVEARPGYVKTQEHAITWRLGVSYSLQ